jgi:hypothetical protein
MKNLSKKIFFVATAAVTLITSQYTHADTSAATFNITGTVGSHVTLTVQDLDGSSSKNLFADVAEADFDNGYIEVLDAIQVRDIRSNKPVYLKIKNNGWTLPAEYDSDAGSKKPAGTDSDFTIKIDTGTLTSTSGNFTVEGSYGSSFVAVTSTAGQMLKLGQTTGTGKKQGMKGGSVDIDTRIVLDPVYDIPGSYSVELEITIADQ